MPAANLWVIAAVLAQGAIAFILVLIVGAIRLPLVGKGDVRLGDIALSREPWPQHEKRVSNAFDNQFQLPVLFYVACGLALYFGPGWIEAVMAWLFVISRIAHAAIFVITNSVIHRFSAFTIGLAMLGLLWLDLAIRSVVLALGAR